MKMFLMSITIVLSFASVSFAEDCSFQVITSSEDDSRSSVLYLSSIRLACSQKDEPAAVVAPSNVIDLEKVSDRICEEQKKHMSTSPLPLIKSFAKIKTAIGHSMLEISPTNFVAEINENGTLKSLKSAWTSPFTRTIESVVCIFSRK